MLVREWAALHSRFYKAFGSLAERGPVDGPKLMVLPGFLATDRTTLGLQRALAEAGYRVIGWGLSLNTGVKADTLDRLVERIERFGSGKPIILVGWSLGGIYAREVAKLRPDLVSRVITLASPFSGDPRANNVWRLYQWVSGHSVDDPPIRSNLKEKPPVPTLAIWSPRDGIIAPACSRGAETESDRQLQLDCTHMGFAVSSRAYPDIVAAVRAFAA